MSGSSDKAKRKAARTGSNGRTLHRWKVTLQDSTGHVSEEELTAYWDPAKTSLEDIAVAKAAEINVFGARDQQGNPLNGVLGLTAELVAA